jgi:pimeloyl-ACP methyl ester carboxylesterase
MQAPTTRILGPARIVALVLIALAVGGLSYLRFAPDAGPVSVSKGAHAGDLTLEPCRYGTEDGSYAADCGTLVVPENRAAPRSRLIALPVTVIHARSAHPGEPVFRLEGGPGLTNMTFSKASRIADRHDVVLVGYRGVDGSVRLDCPEVVSAMRHSADFLSEKSMRARADAFSACATRLRADGVDLAGYTLSQRVDDLEAARKALGYHRIDLLSESAGTRTALIYSWRYPKSIHRSVMVGVNPPGHFLWNPGTTDEQIRHYAALCSQDGSCRGRTDDLAATMKRTAAHVPDHWWFLPIKKGNVRIASFFGLMNATSEAAPISAPMTLSSWLSAAEGDASGFWFLSLAADLVFPRAQIWGDVAAASRADVRAAERYFSSGAHRRTSILGDPGTEFLWSGGRLLHAWPASPGENEYTRVQDSKVETLLIGGSVDFATPARNATDEVLPHLPNGHQVVLAELGHTDDFWSYQPEASSRLVNTFFDSGTVDDSLYEHRTVDFTPGFTYAKIAKIVLGAMVFFPVLAVLSLLLMWRRVGRRAGFGRKAGAVLRSVYPVVLGAGGWLLGALIVLVALPTVPLDDELLAALSIGIPIGLGIYWAWVDRDWPARARTIGLSAAMASALVGGWLGFHATGGLLGVMTTVVGAAVGANLALIALDIVRDRSAAELAVRTGRPAPVTAEA